MEEEARRLFCQTVLRFLTHSLAYTQVGRAANLQPSRVAGLPPGLHVAGPAAGGLPGRQPQTENIERKQEILQKGFL